MRRKPSPALGHDAHAARFAWWVSFLATLTLVAVLGIARSAQALTVPASGMPTTAAVLAAPDDEDGEEEAEASEDEEFEGWECADDEECEEEEDDRGGPEAPEECLLSSAEATVFASANRDRVRMQIRYTTTSPTPVAVAYGLHGSKGALYFGGDRKHFGRHGTLRLSRDLSEDQMAKVMAAKDFTVRLRVQAAPSYCQTLFDRRLDVRRAIPSGLSWQQSE